MSKFLKKYVLIIHRWLALPFFILILTALLARNTTAVSVVQWAQQILMLAMAITGLYIFLLPWWAKWKRNHMSLKGDEEYYGYSGT